MAKIREIIFPGLAKQSSEIKLLRKKLKEAQKISEDATDVAKEAIQKSRKFTTSAGDNFEAKEVNPKKNYKNLTNIANEVPGMPQAIQKIVDSVLSAGWRLSSDEDEATPPNDVMSLLEQPNSEDTWDDVLRETVYNLVVYGDAYWEKVKTEDSKEIAEIFVLATPNTRILVDEDDLKKGIVTVIGYVKIVDVEGSKKEIGFAEDDILHFKTDNPEDSPYGESQLEKQQSMFELLLNSLLWNIRFFKNNAKVDSYIQLPEGVNRDEAEIYADYFEKNFTGLGNNNKTLIQYGGAEIKPLGTAPADIQWLELINLGIKLSTGVLGVPVSQIGITEDSNRSNSEVDRRNFLSERIEPLQGALSSKINKFLQEQFPESIGDFVFMFNNLETEGQEARANTASKLQGTGILSINEARRQIGEDPIDQEWADKHLILSGSFPINLEDTSDGDLSME